MYEIKHAIDVIANDVYLPCFMLTKETLEKEYNIIIIGVICIVVIIICILAIM